jgi:peptidyl-prolyl cis-trans isomerase NIMA-interacting 1
MGSRFSRPAILCSIGWLAACGKTEAPPHPAASAAPAPCVAASAAAQPAPPPSTRVSEPVPESIALQHVLIAFKGAKNAPKTVKRSRAEAKNLAEKVLAEARAGGDFSELAVRYSDDPGAKGSLGNLGKRKRDAFVPAFADAAFRLQEGQISDVVETEFGFHVIKRNQ